MTNRLVTQNSRSKYNKEYNSLLKRDIFYYGNDNIKSYMKKTLTREIICDIFENYDENDYNNIAIYKFILNLIKHQLWENKDASKEFVNFINMSMNQKKYMKEINIYAECHKFYTMLVKKYNIKNKLLDNIRGVNRVKSINKIIISKYKQPIKPTCYLDIGCFDGNITSAIGKNFDLNDTQIHGVDIVELDKMNKNFIFSKYDGKTLPYSDNSFDMITCLMVLHHIGENLDILLKEIYRVAKDDCTLILREHNVINKIECINLDIMHSFYDYVWNYDGEKWQDGLESCQYKSNDEWTQLFNSHGFVLDINPSIFTNPIKNPFKTYMCSYKKSYNIYNASIKNHYQWIVSNE